MRTGTRGRAADGADRFDSIYGSGADGYDALVLREDVDGALPAALAGILRLDGARVVELGAGTGRVTRILAAAGARVRAFDGSAHMLEKARWNLAGFPAGAVTLAVADSRAVPLPGGSADAVVEGWSWGHTITRAGAAWREAAEELVAEASRLLGPGGTLVVIETLGTGAREPAAPGDILPLFNRWLVEQVGFSHRWIRTDYLFPSLDEARRVTEFFFGTMPAHELEPGGTVRIPECTGLWWRRLAPPRGDD